MSEHLPPVPSSGAVNDPASDPVSDPVSDTATGAVNGAVSDLVERIVTELGLDLDAVELRGGGPKRTLRVVIDAEGGVPIDVITQASRELSREFDRSEVMGGVGYTLEVTSRGLDRPLTLARHWVRNVGRLVVVTTTEGERLRGRIAGADDAGAHLEDGTDVAYAAVKNAVIEPELNRRAERNS